MKLVADIKAEITLNNQRKMPVASGYRATHRIKDDYLTTGIHNYIDAELLYPGQTTIGLITFIAPEFYPKGLKTGQLLELYEGSKQVGCARILEIYNLLLER